MGKGRRLIYRAPEHSRRRCYRLSVASPELPVLQPSWLSGGLQPGRNVPELQGAHAWLAHPGYPGA